MLIMKATEMNKSRKKPAKTKKAEGKVNLRSFQLAIKIPR